MRWFVGTTSRGDGPYDVAPMVCGVFTVAERLRIREQLVADARADARISAAALVGSAAADREDRWSDIDLALRLADGLNDPAAVAERWTSRMYQDHDAVDHLDVWAGSTLFRVFLLRSSLQVDLSFWPSKTFTASGSAFRLIFGEANQPAGATPPVTDTLVGWGWLYALHVRTAIARGRFLQALYMINGLRDQVIALACVRHDLPAQQGRGVDDLPGEVTRRLADTVVGELSPTELHRAFCSAVKALLDEVGYLDQAHAQRLTEPAGELMKTANTTHLAGDQPL